MDKIFIGVSNNQVMLSDRSGKGKGLVCNLCNFTVIDLETTGLDPKYDDIIEVGAVRYRNGEAVAEFSSLVNPGYKIDEFISELTGITNEMLIVAPSIKEILPKYLEFIGTDVVVGHNVNFDINFIYDNAMQINGAVFSNDYLDTMRLSRRLFPEHRHHRLKQLVSRFQLNTKPTHRATSDCKATAECLFYMYEYIDANGIEYNSLLPRRSKNIRATDVVADSSIEFDKDHPLFEKKCVFTGVLEKMLRKEAMQLVVNIGGSCGDRVTQDTNYLILGNNDYCKSIKGGKSSKHKKAEQYKLEGYDIEIISEDIFYDMFNIN